MCFIAADPGLVSSVFNGRGCSCAVDLIKLLSDSFAERDSALAFGARVPACGKDEARSTGPGPIFSKVACSSSAASALPCYTSATCEWLSRSDMGPEFKVFSEAIIRGPSVTLSLGAFLIFPMFFDCFTLWDAKKVGGDVNCATRYPSDFSRFLAPL